MPPSSIVYLWHYLSWPGTQQHLTSALSAGIASMSRHVPAVYISSVVHASRVHITCPGMLWDLVEFGVKWTEVLKVSLLEIRKTI